MHAICPRRIRTRRNHPALIRLTANRERLPVQIGIEDFFYSAEKSVKIEMQNCTFRHPSTCKI
jgi:hypothetical protein